MRIGTESRRMADSSRTCCCSPASTRAARSSRSGCRCRSWSKTPSTMRAPSSPIDRSSAHVADGVVVLGDEDRLRQVVGNLFTNVRVHTPSATPVDVDLSAQRRSLHDRRRRPRAGRRSEHVGHIFDRFYRADPGRSRDRGGSGSGCRSRRASSRRTAARSPTAKRLAVARRSPSSCHAPRIPPVAKARASSLGAPQRGRESARALVVAHGRSTRRGVVTCYRRVQRATAFHGCAV